MLRKLRRTIYEDNEAMFERTNYVKLLYMPLKFTSRKREHRRDQKLNPHSCWIVSSQTLIMVVLFLSSILLEIIPTRA